MRLLQVLKRKFEKSGMPYSILKKFTIEAWRKEVVIDQLQLNSNGAFARVNSFRYKIIRYMGWLIKI